MVMTDLMEPPNSALVARRAKLFEAGEYADKGISISTDHLVTLARGFRPVPILIEHQPSPLDLGSLSSVEARGVELFGTLHFTAEAHALVEKSGARGLSVGLARDLSAIREVSLVRHPRVSDAALFHQDTVTFFAEMPPDRSYRDRKVRQQVETLVREGRIAPAQADAAARLLAQSDRVGFDADSPSVAALFRQFLDQAPTSGMFASVARAPQGDFSSDLMMPEEAAFYRRHFPDVSLSEIAKRR